MRTFIKLSLKARGATVQLNPIDGNNKKGGSANKKNHSIEQVGI
jgi:hypothetical protein